MHVKIITLEIESIISHLMLIKCVRIMVFTPLSTIFQLYRGGQFLLEKTGVPRENHPPVASL